MDQRYTELQAWLAQVLTGFSEFAADSWQLHAVSGDASFRRYFRVLSAGRSWIAVDAPPDKESSQSFVNVANGLKLAGVPVPHIYQADLKKGFLLLEDFGDQLLLDQLTPESVEGLYMQALDTLLVIQRCRDIPGGALSDYDLPLLLREVELFREWFLQKLLGVNLDDTDQQMLKLLFDYVIDAALEQPAVFVHRDYHSRNLMYREGMPLGVIDFQDAVLGPVTYDLVSLLRDCYIAWPDEQVYMWVEHYRQALIGCGQTMPDSSHFMRWFDLMGAQRHLKAIGIFARLNLRDGKAGYLADIPRTMNYLINATAKNESLKPVAGWLVVRVLPAMRQSEYFANDVLDHWVMA
ncbi:MAG: aminoglycoside phosphotransferase [Neptuniibacter caesariensis]|uniref:Aminoglycoside phosphotransferase n=1 Tax=Neptuniibacter caesariensis TaxID=207954 RepID=A0A2G6JN86_NEPCE|nr:MAG: aminoglycoside phosphotransferase [Neptuniibacter caesariensis]